jgi:hypothetical protein
MKRIRLIQDILAWRADCASGEMITTSRRDKTHMDVSPDFTAQEASVATSIAVVALRKLGLNADIRYDDAKHCVELDR